MTNTSLPIYDQLINLDILHSRLKRDRIKDVTLVQVLTKRFGRRGDYYSRLVATRRLTERGFEFYTYRINSQGKVSRSWVALNESDVIVEKEII